MARTNPASSTALLITLMLLLICNTTFTQNNDSLWKSSITKFDRGDYHGVISDINSIMDAYTGFPEGYYNRGVARLKLGDIEGACHDLQMARETGLKQNLDIVNYLCDKERIRDFLIKENYGNRKVVPENGYRPAYGRGDTLRGAMRPERSCFDVFFYDLKVRINPDRKMIAGRNAISFTVAENTNKIQLDLFENLRITSVEWNGMNLNFKREYNAFFVEFPRVLTPGERHTVNVLYKGRPVIAENPPWQGGFVWERDSSNYHWAGVACEQLGASSWWPVKDHLSDEPDSMRITLEVPEGYNAVSNGNLRSINAAGRGYDGFEWFVSYPVNNYNVTFYMGRYIAFDDSLITPKDTVMLNYNVLPENLEKAVEHFAQTTEILSFFIEAFGEYPFEKDGFGLVESPYAGMEHQSAIAYGNEYKNTGYRNGQYDYIIVHEAAHEWWGNSITAYDMADAWIHEGFATYAEMMFLEHTFGYDEYMFQLFQNASNILNIWPMYGNHGVNEDSFVGNDIYTKGAMMIHCLRSCINNDTLFFSMIKEYSVSRRYSVVTTNDFISFVNDYTGMNFNPFFNKFLYDTGLPLLEYSFVPENGNLRLNYRWTGVEDGFFMPFSVATNNGKAIRLECSTGLNEVILENTEWFSFYNVWGSYGGSPVNGLTYYNTKWN